MFDDWKVIEIEPVAPGTIIDEYGATEGNARLVAKAKHEFQHVHVVNYVYQLR